MVASGKKDALMADSGSGPKRDGFLDKGLSWDKRLELARAERARIEAEQGPAQITPKVKPWEADTEAEEDTDAAPLQGYPGLPRERRAAVARRMRAAESQASEKSERIAPDEPESRAAPDPIPEGDANPKASTPEKRQPPITPRPVRAVTRPLVLPGATLPDAPEESDAALAVNRLLTAPPAERKSALYGARFDPIPAREPQRRNVLWLIAVVCVLGGLLVGVLVAVGLFFALASDTRKPSPQRLLALLSGKPAASLSAEASSTAVAPSVAASRDREAQGPEIPEIARAEWTSASMANPQAAAMSGSPSASAPRIGEMPESPVAPAMGSAPGRPGAGSPPKRLEVGAVPEGSDAEDLPPAQNGSGPVQVVPTLAGLVMPSLPMPPVVPSLETPSILDRGQARLSGILPDANAAALLPSVALEAMSAGPRLAGLAPSQSDWRIAGFDGPPERSGEIGVVVPETELAVEVEDPVRQIGKPAALTFVEPMTPMGAEPAELVALATLNPRPEASLPASMGLVAPDPALACAACQLTASVGENRTVRLRLPQYSNVRERRAVGALLEGAGFDRVLPGIQALPVSASQVRYFRPEDAEAARLLAELVRADLFDLSWFSPLPPDGTIEVLIASGALPGTMPPG